MTDEPQKVYIEPGRRTGKTLKNEAAMHEALDAGKAVFTSLNGVWFTCTRLDSDPSRIVYTALAVRPVGL